MRSKKKMEFSALCEGGAVHGINNIINRAVCLIWLEGSWKLLYEWVSCLIMWFKALQKSRNLFELTEKCSVFLIPTNK